MGAAPSTGPMSPALIRRIFDPRDFFQASRGCLKSNGEKRPGCDCLAAYHILGGQPERFKEAQLALDRCRAAAAESAGHPPRKANGGYGDATSGDDVDMRTLDRSLGCFLGNVVGDALGAPLEFSSVRYGVSELQGMCHDRIWTTEGYNTFSLQPGQWTDDASMALCVADSLICCGDYDAIDTRQRFHLWNKYGYNNAFGRDSARQPRGSVGLGGNIGMSMTEWQQQDERTPETREGDKYTSGNGSIMRNGAVPVWFRDDAEAGMAVASQQSKTTHRGHEAAELCRLLTFICTKFINGAGKDLLEDLSHFKTPSYGVECLANSRCEEPHAQNSNAVSGSIVNRQWNWRSADHRYCAKRAEESPGYIGSYAMDGMCMALHVVWSTASFEEATLKAANLRGDSDSVCAVVGQLAGSLYGASSIPQAWLDRVHRWDSGSILARAFMLHERSVLGPDEFLSDAACATAANLGTDVGELEFVD